MTCGGTAAATYGGHVRRPRTAGLRGPRTAGPRGPRTAGPRGPRTAGCTRLCLPRPVLAPHARGTRSRARAARRAVDMRQRADKFMGLRVFARVPCIRLTAADTMGVRRRTGSQAGGPGPLPTRTQDNLTSSASCSARLGSPLALQRRAHPGESGWIPARAWALVHPRLYLINALVFGAADRRQRLTPDG